MNYDAIIKEIGGIYRRLDDELSNIVSAEEGIPVDDQRVRGLAGALSKTFFNYAFLLLYDKMLRERGDDISTFDKEAEAVISGMSKERPVPKDVLISCILKKDDTQNSLREMFEESDNTPKPISAAIDETKRAIDNFFEENIKEVADSDDQLSINVDYGKASKKVFELGNQLGDEIRHLASREKWYPGSQAVEVASNAATALFEYATLLFRINLRTKLDDIVGEFEKQDEQMVKAFADTLMISPTALDNIITTHDDPAFWKNLLAMLKLEPPFGRIEMDKYLEKAERLADDTIGVETKEWPVSEDLYKKAN